MRVTVLASACIVLSAACDQNQSVHTDGEHGDAPIKEQIGEPAFKSRIEAVDDKLELGEQTQELVGDALCKPCTSNAECGTNNYCLVRSDGVRFCGRDCRSAACPTSYSCMRLSSTVSQCVPPQLDCSRVPQDAGAADAGVADAGPRDAAVDASAPDAATTDAGQVPNSTACSAASSWSATWSGFEDEVLRLSNQYRTAGASCGGTPYAAAPALRMNPALRCAARLHSRDMQLRNFFSHTNPDGVTFDKRITAAGYSWRTVGENIAAGYQTPTAVVQGWMQSTGHCQNIMNPAFTEIGVGFYDSYRWTQDFGTAW